MKDEPVDKGEAKKNGLIALGTIIAVLISGCSLFDDSRNGVKDNDPLASVKAEAKLVCSYFNGLHSYNGKDKKVAEINRVAFSLARNESNNELARLFCQYKKGMVLPSKDIVPEYPEPIPVMFKRLKALGVIQTVDRCKLEGLTKKECNCIKQGGSSHDCQKYSHKSK